MTENEKRLLVAVLTISSHYKPVDPETLGRFGTYFFGSDCPDWTEAQQALIQRGLLGTGGRGLYLTCDGLELAGQLYQSAMFTGQYLQCEQSGAYASYCERVYGRNLTQFNMADMVQLGKLIEALALSSDQRTLDLGCGLGTVTEYISDQTSAPITGIDNAVGAIDRARERTEGKRGRLTFVEGDMNTLPFDNGSFDRILSIDTLCFIEDLGKTLGALTNILAPGGQMGLFWTGGADPDGAATASRTQLGKVLDEAGLRYDSWEFSESLKDHFKTSLSTLEELKSLFEQEGAVDLYMSRRDESEGHLKAAEAKGVVRFLYRVFRD